VYVHVYDEYTRPLATQIARQLESSLGFGRAPIENVVATAERRGRTPPYVWTTPAMVVHAGASKACVDAVARAMPAGTLVRDLPASLKSNPGMIELWLPPNSGAATAN
jgi:hypothetical protein